MRSSGGSGRCSESSPPTLPRLPVGSSPCHSGAEPASARSPGSGVESAASASVGRLPTSPFCAGSASSAAVGFPLTSSRTPSPPATCSPARPRPSSRSSAPGRWRKAGCRARGLRLHPAGPAGDPRPLGSLPGGLAPGLGARAGAGAGAAIAAVAVRAGSELIPRAGPVRRCTLAGLPMPCSAGWPGRFWEPGWSWS